MADIIRSLSSKTSEAICSMSTISDYRCALEAVLMNALEASSSLLTVNCNLSDSTITICDNGCGFGLSALTKIGIEPTTTKRSSYHRGIGLFSLTRVASISIASRSPLTGHFKHLQVHSDGNRTLRDAKPLNNGLTTKVEVKDLFQSLPVRRQFLDASSASQRRSILQLLTHAAASHPSVHFSFSMLGMETITLPETDLFSRLETLFANSFPRGSDWLPIDFYSTHTHLKGFIISPHSGHFATSRMDDARLLFCRERCIASPEITSTIDTIWRSYSSSKTHEKTTSIFPIYYLELEGPEDEIELFRGIDVSSLILYHTQISFILKSLRPYLHDILSKFPHHKPIESHETDSKSSPPKSPSLSLQLPAIDYLKEELEPILTTSEIWNTSMTRVALQHGNGQEVSACRPARRSTLGSKSLSEMKVIGQVDDKFIVSMTRDGVLCAFDQHAVHERLRYEFLLRQLHQKSPLCVSYSRIYPTHTLSISLTQYHRLKIAQKALESWHWQFELQVDPDNSSYSSTVVVSQVPVISKKALLPEHIVDHMEEIIARGTSKHFVPALFVSIIKSKACRGAIMFGDKLSLEEMESMVHELDKCAQPFACCHGRTNVALLTDI